VADLEALEAVAGFSFLAADVENGVDQFGALCVMAFRPIVAGSCLTEDEVVWAEDLTVWASADGVHGSWLEVHEDGAWNVASTGRFVEVDVDALELEIAVALVCSGWINTVFVADYFPEL
jgi:hypothetical protein